MDVIMPDKVSKESFDLLKQIISIRYNLKLLICYMAILSFGIIFFIYITKNDFNFSQVLILLFSLNFVIFTIWYIYSRLPKTKRNKAGFVVALYCEDEKERLKIKNDFIDTLHSLVKNGIFGKYFHFFTLPNFFSEDIHSTDDAYNILKKCKARFFIYGRIRFRELNKQPQHIIDMNGIVTHKPIPENIQKLFTKEFSELFPKRVSINQENDLLSFEFTADYVNIIARYLIGIAFLVSGFLKRSEEIFIELENLIKPYNSKLPHIKKIKERLPIRFNEIYSSWFSLEYDKWLDGEGDDINVVKNIAKYSDLTTKHMPDTYSSKLKNSIKYFLDGRKISECKKILLSCRKEKDVVWLYNLAFIEAYQEYMDKAISHYKKISKRTVNHRIIREVESFMSKITTIEPDKYQIYFCLGYINWKIKGDINQAIQDFRKFIELDITDKFKEQKRLAQEYITLLKSKDIHQVAS